MAQNRYTEIFRDDGHTNRIIGNMNQMRKDAHLYDVNLVTSDGEISCHKMVLAAASPYFYEIFCNSEKKPENKVNVTAANSQGLSLVLEYIYTSEVEITDENVQDMLIAANKLQLTDLRDVCMQFLKDHLHLTNCFNVRDFADSHNLPFLLKDAEDFILENFLDVAKTQNFLKLSPEEVASIISKDELNVGSEEKVLESVLTWVKHDLNSRRQYFVPLMKNVRICYLPQDYIMDTFLNEPLINNDPDCKDFKMAALECFLPKGNPRMTTNKRKLYEELPKILLVVGGASTPTAVEYYDFKAECWSKLADLTVQRNGSGATSFSGKCYIIGGRNDCSINIYDTAADKWIPSNAMQFKRELFGVATLRKCIYTVGGKCGEFLNTVEKFNPETEQWSLVAPMLTKRFRHGVGVIDGLLYAVGGGDSANYFSLIECYNPITNTWTHVTSMQFRRSDVAVAVLNGILYAVGGYDGSQIFKSAEAFDPKTGNWTTIKDMHNCRRNAAIVTVNNLLYVIGGLNGTQELASVEVYDPNINTWTVLPKSMNLARSCHCAVLIDKRS